jgi:hypothetical protein
MVVLQQFNTCLPAGLASAKLWRFYKGNAYVVSTNRLSFLFPDHCR